MACDLCNDSGWILYDALTKVGVYQYAAKCICPAGQALGPAIPDMRELGLDPDMIRKMNAKKWGKKEWQQEGITKRLKPAI